MRSTPRPGATGTRGEILTLLCGSDQTVSELASALGISRNAVREHLQRLEGEDLVRHEVVRRGVGKPAHEYRLTTDGERLLSRAYLPLLLQLFDALGAHLDEGTLLQVLHEVGRGIAAGRGAASGSLRERVEAASAFLGELGGQGRVEERDGSLWIESRCCPIGALASRHPLACKAVEALVAEVAGEPVVEACDRSGPPRCRLRVAQAS